MSTAVVNSSGVFDPTTGRGDLAGRVFLWFASVSTVFAFGKGIVDSLAADDDRLFVEFWRMTSYFVFIAIFAVLALRPRRSPVIWEATFLAKSALVVFTAFAVDIPEAGMALVADSMLVVCLIVGWFLSQGRESWRSAG
ncbi:hypothetical protein [Kribbella sp. DT2]|uniref:hypothetical protein n=1 Tax=Kribbella sp. DT2 TaxID=3393427 RepID=UPI003CEC6736